MAQTSINFFEDLAAVGITCPHTDAFVPGGEKIYFRVLKNSTVSSDNFLPTIIREGRPLPPGYDNCIGKSVSIYDDLDGMINGFFKLPSNRGKRKTIGLLKLALHDGMLKQTFDNKNHYSWWRSTAFDISTVTTKEILL